MSEYHVIETEFKDQQVLIEALEEMGYHPEVYDKPKNLLGYQGDKRQQKAHIIIPRRQVGGASNDVGFEKVDGKYICHASGYDAPWRTGAKISKLKQTYGEKKIMKSVRQSSRYSFMSRKVTEDGEVKIKIRRI